MRCCLNRIDDEGSLSNLAKVAIGVGVIALCATVVALTGGAATGAVVATIHCVATGAPQGAAIGAATGAVSGAAAGAVSHRLSTGGWDGAGQAAVDGAASGFMSGAIAGAVTGAVTSPYCFVAGTLVRTKDGEKPIENIEIGDCVWAWDENTGKVALKPVLETYVNETYELVHVFVNGEEIISTPGHPFYSPVNGWIDAVHLRAGDILVLVNGEYVVVEKIQHELLEEPINVYNFNVDEFHTYFVSGIGVLVHNMCKKTLSKPRFDENQSALLKMAKQDRKNGGISLADAEAYWDLVKECGLDAFKNFHGPKLDSYLGGTQLHIKINGLHINIY